MKKISLLFATLLVLVSSIVFCSCNDGYKDLKITCDTESIDLVIDDENLAKQNLVFELSGAKSWGEISIVSKPLGMVQVGYQIENKQCNVTVKALQPTGDGASLIITHLGSGKSLGIPLNIGQKLQTVESSNLDFIIQAPKFTQEEINDNVVKEIEIPTKQLLNCYPLNYTDTIAWQLKDTALVAGVDVVSYNKAGDKLNTTFQANTLDPNANKIDGVSSAVKSVVAISDDYNQNTTIVINPISILDGKAILHKDVNVEVCIVDLLKSDDIKIASATHGNEDGLLKDLVLISNPDSGNPREVAGLSGYDYYSTAVIDFKLEVENPVQGEGLPETILQDLSQINFKLTELYEINISTNINALKLENVDFGKIRAIATNTCVGKGEIKIDFVPKQCVGDIKAFSINIPCLVGERATGFKATNNGETIEVTKENTYTFSSITALNDSNSLGQAFKFDVLSTNTLSAFTEYQIKINKNLLYINLDYVDEITKTSPYIRNNETKESFDLTEILDNKYEYQISILKEGREITFYEIDGNLVSEPLNNKNTIYMKWIRTNGQDLGATDFGISISNIYNGNYDIANHGFDKTILTYNLEFNRQRTVESISYIPVKITTTGGVEIEDATDAGNDWQFYFEPNMFDNTTYYGIRILEVLGLNSTALTPAELSNINIKISIQNVNLGFAEFDGYGAAGTYINNYLFDFDSDDLEKNIILIGKIGELEFGDYTIEMTQTNKDISSIGVRVYKNLTEEDVSVSVPTADFEGELLQYQYVQLTAADWVVGNYYEFVGGQYVKSTGSWNPNKSYYQKVDIPLLIDGVPSVLDLGKTYILATSKQYKVDMQINNKDFLSISGQSVETRVVARTTDTLNASYVSYLCGKDEDGNNVINTGKTGSFNTQTNEKNYIQLIYTIQANTYDYYKLNSSAKTSVKKDIYIYVYEPLTFATFNKTMLYKYDYESIPNIQFKQEKGKETLNVELNNNSDTILNYVDIKWSASSDGISEFVLNSKDSATFTFRNKNQNYTAFGTIIATLTQFGRQYPIYCNYNVRKPILSEQVILNTTINSFNSGEGYINLKVGESVQIEAEAKSSRGEVSLPGFSYAICSTTGYAIDGIATIDNTGLLTAQNAGRVKLVIIAKDVIKDSLFNITNYFNTYQYIENDAYLIIDVIISDGSEQYPFLIASGSDFRNIANDYYYMGTDNYGNPIRVNAEGDTSKTNDYNYALVNDIDLSGQAISFETFNGTISSFQENATSSNRFTIYGVMLNEDNPNLFKLLNTHNLGFAVLEDINIYVDINYTSTKVNASEVLIGLIGQNHALIEDVTVVVNGNINANNIENRYTIGSMVAQNSGIINITNTALVGVQGEIVVTNSGSSIVVLGGLIGKNVGTLQGANQNIDVGDDGEVKYEVYYDNQGATADIKLQVKSVDVENLDSSAVGGIIGTNYGTVTNVYAIGSVFGTDDANNLKVNNIGGLIGKNQGQNTISATVDSMQRNDIFAVKSIVYAADSVFQINNSYSNVKVMGNYNVGGVVGSDVRGSYKKVYYEIYENQQSVVGNNNVGGLIGCAEDSNLYYCYASNFAWGYVNSVEVYDIVGQTNVGGLIGLAKSSRVTQFNHNTYSYSAMNIVSSLASVSLTGTYNVSGLVGRLDNYGAIYTAYYYGVIDPKVQITNLSPITKLYKDNSVIENTSYNNIYAIVNGVEKILITDTTYYQGVGFGVNEQYNNGKPYIIFTYEDGKTSNLVSIIPTVVQVNKAFDTYYNNTAMYKPNSLGDYVWDKAQRKYIVYDNLLHNGMTRHSLIAELIETGDSDASLSDYRKSALVLYYYQFNDMSGENALEDLYYLNTVNMKDIVADKGIIVLPNTFKRFNLRTSDPSVASILSGGRLLLNGEGQVTITLISTLNPNATASFVVIVRSKVLKFNLCSSANLRDEYNIKNTTINIVKNTSKLIYVDYSSIIDVRDREYAYKSATNMAIKFEINHSTIEGKDINKYITLNGICTTLYKVDKYKVDEDGNYVKDGDGNYIIDNENGQYMIDKYIYTIPYGTPITISVHEYIDGEFIVTAKPYVVANYKNDTYSKDVLVELSSYFNTSFKVATKKGASSINIDKTQIDMMPADAESNINVKITTDVAVDKLNLELKAVGNIWEVVDINNSNNVIKVVNMLDISYNGNPINLSLIDDDATGEFGLAGIPFDDEKLLQSLNLSVKLNDLSHYVDVPFKLQLTMYVLNGNQKISTTLFIDVKPQIISSIMALNYRMKDGITDVSLQNAYQSKVIRPGQTNIITVDIAPNIAVYDYIEVMDTTAEDKILFQQVKPDLSSLENMDIWVDNGIKLKKYDVQTSKLFLLAKLPLKATANITHTIQIVAYDKAGKALYTTYLNLEAVMYPTVVMTYTYPNGETVVADTREGAQQEKTSYANLAIGVEASITIETYNIDADTLKYDITITGGGIDVTSTYKDIIKLEEMYDRYILRFDSSDHSAWDGLVGKQINVSFTASKTLNGITETCKATIVFNIKRVVVHGVSMTHVSSQGNLYGNWDEEFETKFYFDRTDISYYYKGYWNVQYTMENTNPNNYEGTIKSDMHTINNILVTLNTLGSNGVNIYLANKAENDRNNMFALTGNYNRYADEGISIVNKENKFIIKASKDSGINDKKLVVDFKLMYNDLYPMLTTDDVKPLSNEFGFDVSKKTTPFDEYITISTQQEFENMLEGKYYRLGADIDLNNYNPINVAIGGLSGNGYIITVNSFNVDQLVLDYSSGGMYVGLFGILAEDSVVQNLQVNYNDIRINLNDSTSIQEQHTNNIYFGGVAGQNLGVITNAKVSGKFSLKAQYISADRIDFGGITAVNGSAVSTKVATITGSSVELEMSAMALIGGVSGTNYGKITNTNFNGRIISKDTNQYVAEVTTAGFVVENMNGAYISLSYVECGLQQGLYNIHSVGRTAGFVLNNSGTINNCYISETALSSQGNIGGFVYQSSGSINNSYAYASLGNSLFYNEFIYSTENIGEINNCYVVTQSSINIYVKGLSKISPNQMYEQEQYVGFIFAKGTNGVWSISDNGPKLLNSGFNSNVNEYDNIYNIYDLETYEGTFERFGDIIEGKTFRLVRDIDFELEGLDTNPVTFNKTLRASFEGNDMALKNYNIYKTENVDSIGLFANIGNLGLGIYVRNLILQPTSIKAASSNAVGALAGVIDGASVYNITIDSSNVLMLGKNAVGGLAGIIKGSFEVMGVSSNISAFATYYHNIGNQYNLYTGKNVTGNTLLDNTDEVSYAGSIAGIVDGYDFSNNSMSDRGIESYYTISNINIDGDLVLIGETVGGAFGLVGERTLVDNVNYNLPSETLYQGVYVSGGLVGENRGIIRNANIYAYKYTDGIKERVNTTTSFDNYARVNGGIVGFNIGGLIDTCTSDIDVYSSKTLSTVGGIVGRNVEGSVYDCSVSGSVEGYFTGGIAGTDYSYKTIIKQQSGVGSVTISSAGVYKNIQQGVKYAQNCKSNYVEKKLYSGNVFTDEFMTKFIAKAKNHYTFNHTYMDATTNSLVNANSIFGLTIGLSDSLYTTIVTVDGADNNYTGRLIVELTRGEDTRVRQDLTLTYQEKTQTINPITNVIATNFAYDNMDAIFLYIIAFIGEGYDSWSSTLGYSQEYIALSPTALQPVVPV